MQTIGRYKLLDTLGQGGMGVVYRAFDTLLERTVALKVIGTQIDSNPETRARFLREARAAGQLSHRNIVTIFDLGEHDGHPFLAMEYLEGEDLQQRLSGGVKMSIARKVDLAIDICEGLEYAHAHGVVHRDVKPANVFITTPGQVKILDFGLARLITSQLTNSNMLIGTLNYMAPEQVRGERADHRADIFSVGVLYYELLCNRKAFEGDSFASTMYKILQEVPEPICQVDATVPRALAAIVERALAKPLDERYQSMTALREDLLLYRDQLRKSDSGATVATPARPDSSPDAITMLAPASAQGMSDVRALGSGAAYVAPGSGAAASVSAPSSGPAQPAGAPSGSGTSGVTLATRWPWIIVAGLVLAGGAVAAPWLLMRHAPPAAAPQPTEQRPAPIDTSAAIATAQRSLESHDYAAAERQAQAVLQQVPGDREAARILDRARTAASAVEGGLRDARSALASGDFQAASRAAGDVLTVDNGNAEARQIMEQGATRAGARSAADARTRMTGAREQARAVNAPTLAAPAYRAAVRAEQSAQRLLQAGRNADATARFYEASGLYQSAASLAQVQAEEKAQPDAAPVAPAPPATGTSSAAKTVEPSPAPPPPAVAPRPALPEPQPTLPVLPSPPPPTPPAATPAPAPAPAPADDSSPRGDRPTKRSASCSRTTRPHWKTGTSTRSSGSGPVSASRPPTRSAVIFRMQHGSASTCSNRTSPLPARAVP